MNQPVATSTTSIGEYLIERLKALGLTDVFGIPGDFVLGFYDLLEKRGVRVQRLSVTVLPNLSGPLLGMDVLDNIVVAVPFLILLGGLGGFLVVPMNALLQHRGHNLMGAGRSIAVQNFNENLSILLMLSLYALILQLQGSWVILVALFSLMMTVVTACFMRWPGRPPIKPAPSANDHPP